MSRETSTFQAGEVNLGENFTEEEQRIRSNLIWYLQNSSEQNIYSAELSEILQYLLQTYGATEAARITRDLELTGNQYIWPLWNASINADLRLSEEYSSYLLGSLLGIIRSKPEALLYGPEMFGRRITETSVTIIYAEATYRLFEALTRSKDSELLKRLAQQVEINLDAFGAMIDRYMKETIKAAFRDELLFDGQNPEFLTLKNLFDSMFLEWSELEQGANYWHWTMKRYIETVLNLAEQHREISPFIAIGEAFKLLSPEWQNWLFQQEEYMKKFQAFMLTGNFLGLAGVIKMMDEAQKQEILNQISSMLDIALANKEKDFLLGLSSVLEMMDEAQREEILNRYGEAVVERILKGGEVLIPMKNILPLMSENQREEILTKYFSLLLQRCIEQGKIEILISLSEQGFFSEKQNAELASRGLIELSEEIPRFTQEPQNSDFVQLLKAGNIDKALEVFRMMKETERALTLSEYWEAIPPERMDEFFNPPISRNKYSQNQNPERSPEDISQATARELNQEGFHYSWQRKDWKEVISILKKIDQVERSKLLLEHGGRLFQQIFNIMGFANLSELWKMMNEEQQTLIARGYLPLINEEFRLGFLPKEERLAAFGMSGPELFERYGYQDFQAFLELYEAMTKITRAFDQGEVDRNLITELQEYRSSDQEKKNQQTESEIKTAAETPDNLGRLIFEGYQERRDGSFQVPDAEIHDVQRWFENNGFDLEYLKTWGESKGDYTEGNGTRVNIPESHEVSAKLEQVMEEVEKGMEPSSYASTDHSQREKKRREEKTDQDQEKNR